MGDFELCHMFADSIVFFVEQNPSKTSACQLLLGEHRIVQEMFLDRGLTQKHVQQYVTYIFSFSGRSLIVIFA